MGVEAAKHLRIGTAGWTIPRAMAERFAPEGSHLLRYASLLSGVEVNSSFHKPHRRATWERWAANAPAGFRFAVKIPKRITHEAKLIGCGVALLEFFEQVGGLNAFHEPKLGPVLIQLPPSLQYDEGVAREFLGTVRELHKGQLVCEPRHATWFTGDADRLFCEFGVARVAADPPAGSPLAAQPGGDTSLKYWRLHGQPRTYYSEYGDDFLQDLAQRLTAKAAVDQWVIFDNTALGFATANALRLLELMNC